MKRILAALALSFCIAVPAAADTLAAQLREEARMLHVYVTKVADPSARSRPQARSEGLSPIKIRELQSFAFAASRLSTEIDKSGGPADLRCIFRGMAAETEKQLAAIAAAKTNADALPALGRLGAMLKDAYDIAPAVDGGKTTAASSSRAAAAQCPAVRDF